VERFQQFANLLEELRRGEDSIGLAALTVAVRELSALADRMAVRYPLDRGR
jgi:hypothetical protein